MDSPHDNTHLPQADDSVATMEIMAHPQTGTAKPISTDLLFSMPPELLLPIFSFVGVENFRRDVRRLAVCKEWYVYARPILLSNLRLWSTDLLPMLHAMRKDASLAGAQEMTKHVHLTVIKGLSLSMGPTILHLEQLVSRLKVFAALRTVVIRTSGQALINSQVFASFATIQQLTSLEMDLESIHFEQDWAHLCDSINRLIPTLKSLRCRLPYICNDLLETPPGDLEELIICITPQQNSTLFATRQCSTGLCFSETQHRAIFETRLAQFAASMREPKIVRLVHHFWTFHKTYAFDAIRKRRFFLGQFPAWDADGVLLPEDWDEDEESESEEVDYWRSDEIEDWDWEFEEGQDWEEDEESDEGEETDELSDTHEDLLDEPLSD